MRFVLVEQSPTVVAFAFFVVGLIVGGELFRWGIRLTADEPFDAANSRHLPLLCRLPACGPLLARSRCPYRGVNLLGWGTAVELLTGTVFAGFVIAYLKFRCQTVPNVRPDEAWLYLRIVFHLLLIALLMVATVTDFRDYVIPDRITLTGILIGVAAATLSGDLQMIHIWVDWNQEIPGFRGAYLPEWIKDHHHWHGLAWSLAGLTAGAGFVWIVRFISTLILGQEAMGLGDVTLMAMVGSFLGWQPVLMVLILSPLCGLAMAAGSRLLTGKTYIPFGPFLALATIIVLFSWKWLWMLELGKGTRHESSVRKLFGDWPAILILIGIAMTALVLLLGLLRMYRELPGKDRGN